MGTLPQSAQTDRERLNSYVEADLAAWVRREANHRGYSTSGFVRWILLRVRAEMLQGQAPGGTITDDGEVPYSVGLP